MAGWYCTLEQAENAQKADATTDAVETAVIRNAIVVVSRRIDEEMVSTSPVFLPWMGEKKIVVSEVNLLYEDTVFNAGMPIQAVTAVSYSRLGSPTPTPITDQVTVDEGFLVGSTGCFSRFYDRYGSGTRLYITGTWVWHKDYANAWAQVTTLTEPIVDTTTTTITVASSTVKEPDGIFRAFSEGSFIRVDNEWMIVTAYNDTTKVLTVRRGVNGSTAAVHVDNVPVYLFLVEPTIRDVTARQAALMYNRRGAFQTTTVDGFGVTTYPQDLLPQLLRTLNNFQMR